MGRKTEKRPDQISCCVFDLECTNLNADFGVVLCGCVLPAGGKVKTFRADELNPRWATRRSDDSAVVKAIVDELCKYDIWVAHNGARFDVPYLRTRMAKCKMPPLSSQFKLVDPCQLARNKLKMSYNSLEKLGNFLGIRDVQKTEVLPDAWIRAALDGDKRSMNYIAEHCVADVKLLERVVGSLKSYCTQYNGWGSSF